MLLCGGLSVFIEACLEAPWILHEGACYQSDESLLLSPVVVSTLTASESAGDAPASSEYDRNLGAYSYGCGFVRLWFEFGSQPYVIVRWIRSRCDQESYRISHGSRIVWKVSSHGILMS